MTRRDPGDHFDVAGMREVIRDHLARANAFITATDDLIERTWDGNGGEDNDDDRITRRRNHVAHWNESAKLAVRAAAETREGLRGFLARLRGWSDARAVALGLRSLALALAHRSARAGTSSPLVAIGKAGGFIGRGGAL